MLWGGLAATFVNLVLLSWQNRAALALPHFLVFGIVFVVIAALTTWITLKIRAGRNWARLVLLIVNAVSIPSFFGKVAAAFSLSILIGAATTTIYVLDYLAAALLFVGTSNAWFKRQKSLRTSVAQQTHAASRDT
jgi:hypothetical protein